MARTIIENLTQQGVVIHVLSEEINGAITEAMRLLPPRGRIEWDDRLFGKDIMPKVDNGILRLRPVGPESDDETKVIHIGGIEGLNHANRASAQQIAPGDYSHPGGSNNR